MVEDNVDDFNMAALEGMKEHFKDMGIIEKTSMGRGNIEA